MQASKRIFRGVNVAAAVALFLAGSAATDAQRRRNDNSAMGIPVATTSLVRTPEAYYDKLVTISAGVERVISKTIFVVDQRKATGPAAVAPIGAPVLVVAPFLDSQLKLNSYLQIKGQLMTFGAASFNRLATSYAPDIGAEEEAAYHGQPVLVASSVLDSTYKELALRPPPTPEEEALSAAMKAISGSMNAVRAATQASQLEPVKEHSARLDASFAQTEPVWSKLALAPAQEWARAARGHAAAIDRASTAGDWDAAKASAAALNTMCQNCHGAYRERRDDGNFGLKFVLRPPSP
jgi:hypothetical protein